MPRVNLTDEQAEMLKAILGESGGSAPSKGGRKKRGRLAASKSNVTGFTLTASKSSGKAKRPGTELRFCTGDGDFGGDVVLSEDLRASLKAMGFDFATSNDDPRWWNKVDGSVVPEFHEKYRTELSEQFGLDEFEIE